MQVQKLRGAADANDLVPAGTFFAQLAAKLEEANDNEALRRAERSSAAVRLRGVNRPRACACARFVRASGFPCFAASTSLAGRGSIALTFRDRATCVRDLRAPLSHAPRT